MGRELDHREASELLGVYACDAVDGVEREALGLHITGCGWCQAEVVEHREVVALLTSGLEGPPAGLWERISGSLEETPPPLDLAAVVALNPHLRRQPQRRVAAMVAALVAVAAVLVVGVVGIVGSGVFKDDLPPSQVALVHGDVLQRTIDAAVADPAATKVELRSPDGALFADAWMLPDGRGYLVSNNLPRVGSERTYQLWALEGIDRVSVGLLGSGREPSAFRATGPITALAITEEMAGGVTSTVKDPLVVGILRTS